MDFPDEVDVAIVGAGAAGIAAARTVRAAGKSVLILEAADRIGGRAHTVQVDGMALDLGCGWLHSAERNPMVDVAGELGFAVDRTRSAWGQQWRELGISKAQQADAGEAFDAFSDRLRANPSVEDRASDAFEPGCIWNSWIDALSGYINGAPFRDISVADYLAYDEAASETNWRVPRGYGSLIAAAGEGLPIALETAVGAIDAGGSWLSVLSARGQFRAKAVIVTVSSQVLASGAIRFAPALDGWLHAASVLPLGLADKLFLGIDGAQDLEADTHLLGNPWRTATGSYYVRPFGSPVIECFVAGDCARVLEGAGDGEAAAFAIDELVALLGSGWRRRLHPVAGSAWARDSLVQGSYSHALPGHAAARAMLARPAADGRILFAGEACSAQDFSTAHGAWATGTAAAEAALALV